MNPLRGNPVRQAAIFLLVLYAVLTAYSSFRVAFNLPFLSFFTPLLTVLSFVFALLHASQRFGWGRALLLVALCIGISLLFESVGVATGLVFGPYHYTDRLGPRFLGLVPYLIATAWFMMMYPSLVIAQALLDRSGQPQASLKQILLISALGGMIMTAWDLAMDPLMVSGGHWIWDGPLSSRPYFGVPLQNYWGWWLTTFVTFALFLLISRSWQRRPRKDSRFDQLAVFSYLVTGISTVATDLLIGLGGPGLVGLFAMGPWVVLAWRELKQQTV